jgi:adenosylmethionine-8-amino-7-oxononanoate aminotransferase
MANVAPALRAFFLDAGLILRPLGNSIYVMPPYCTTAGQITAIFDAITDAADHFG